jgi:hypothetical protein
MSTDKSKNTTMDQKQDNPLFSAFPEPHAWALSWDDTALQASALQASSRPKPPNPKSTPTR